MESESRWSQIIRELEGWKTPDEIRFEELYKIIHKEHPEVDIGLMRMFVEAMKFNENK